VAPDKRDGWLMRALRGCWLCASLVVAWSAVASAEPREPGWADGTRVAISAENLFGLSYVSAEAAPSSAAGSDGGGRLSWLDVSLFGDQIGRTVTPYALPRLAIDALVAARWTAGGAVTFFRTRQSAGPGQDDSLTSLVLAPRVGCVARLSPRLSLWPRLGVTYARTWGYSYLYSMSRGVETNADIASVFAVGVEAPLALTLATRAAVTFGPAVNVGIAGRRVHEDGVPPGASPHPLDVELRAGLLFSL
jgi:hypothetical protein